MWCSKCGVPINVEHKNFGVKHLESVKHKKAKSSGQRPFGAAEPRVDESPVLVEKKQQPLASVFNKMNTENNITSDFAAVFGHAGIPLEKLDHPSIKGRPRFQAAFDIPQHCAKTLCKHAWLMNNFVQLGNVLAYLRTSG